MLPPCIYISPPVIISAQCIFNMLFYGNKFTLQAIKLSVLQLCRRRSLLDFNLWGLFYYYLVHREIDVVPVGREKTNPGKRSENCFCHVTKCL